MEQFGFTSVSTPIGFVASMDAACVAVVCVYAVTGIARLWEDEQFDRLDLVFAARVTRTAWLGAGTVATAVVVGVVDGGDRRGHVARGRGHRCRHHLRRVDGRRRQSRPTRRVVPRAGGDDPRHVPEVDRGRRGRRRGRALRAELPRSGDRPARLDHEHLAVAARRRRPARPGQLGRHDRDERCSASPSARVGFVGLRPPRPP